MFNAKFIDFNANLQVTSAKPIRVDGFRCASLRVEFIILGCEICDFGGETAFLMYRWHLLLIVAFELQTKVE